MDNDTTGFLIISAMVLSGSAILFLAGALSRKKVLKEFDK